MDGEESGDKHVNEIVRNLVDQRTALDEGLSANAQLNGHKTNTPVFEPARNDNPCYILGERSSVAGFPSVDFTREDSGEEREKIVGELQNCLPKWVTRPQILDMIRGFGGNVIEIVNNFYEHETEFYEQAAAVVSSTFGNRIGMGIDVAPISQLEFVESIPKRNEGSQFTRVAKFQGMTNSLRQSISPKKQNKMINSKPKKKAKAASKVESIGPKQAAITKFFTKISSKEAKD